MELINKMNINGKLYEIGGADYVLTDADKVEIAGLVTEKVPLTEPTLAWMAREYTKSVNKWPYGDIIFSVTEADGKNAKSQRFIVPTVPGKTYMFTWDVTHSNMPDIDATGEYAEMSKSGWAKIYNAVGWDSKTEDAPVLRDCGPGSPFTAPSDFILVELYGSFTIPTNNTAKYEKLMLVEGTTALPYQPYGGGDPAKSGDFQRFKTVYRETFDKSVSGESFAKQVLLENSDQNWVLAYLSVRGSHYIMWGFITGDYGKMFLTSYGTPLFMYAYSQNPETKLGEWFPAKEITDADGNYPNMTVGTSNRLVRPWTDTPGADGKGVGSGSIQLAEAGVYVFTVSCSSTILGETEPQICTSVLSYDPSLSGQKQYGSRVGFSSTTDGALYVAADGFVRIAAVDGNQATCKILRYMKLV